jgi:hypothetical protein
MGTCADDCGDEGDDHDDYFNVMRKVCVLFNLPRIFLLIFFVLSF